MIALKETFMSRLLTEELMTRIGFGFSAMMVCVASNPSMTGIRMSMVTRSGFSEPTISTACRPFFATPTTVSSGSDSRMATRSFWIKMESSTTRIRIFLFGTSSLSLKAVV